jgi:ethanolamine utilization protein EutA
MHEDAAFHTHTDGGVVYETQYTSVGIDVGSSTTHLTVSELVVGRLASHFHRKPEILRRQVSYRSPIMFTPFCPDGAIDHEAIRAFVEQSYCEAGLKPDSIASGAVICTGEAARRKNAKAITEALAHDSGRFVCATAGHHFEAVLAAHGSGSVDISHLTAGPVVNIDIGGGTAKRSLISNGIIENTAAINVGARLIAMDANGVVVRAEAAGLKIAESIGIDASPGNLLTNAQCQSIASEMSRILIGFLGLAELSPIGRELLVTDSPVATSKPFWLVCSGGVSEFFYGRAESNPGDLGPRLGATLRRDLEPLLGEDKLRQPLEGIRATVIGACQFTLQVSGETVFATDTAELPINNVPVVTVPLNWNDLSFDSAADATAAAISSDDQEAPLALFFGGADRFGYGKVRMICDGIATAFQRRSRREQVVLIFSHNMARTIGQTLRKYLPSGPPFVCLDEIEVGNMDYLDIGLPPDGDTYLPIVVKSLVFK